MLYYFSICTLKMGVGGAAGVGVGEWAAGGGRGAEECSSIKDTVRGGRTKKSRHVELFCFGIDRDK